MRNPALAAAKWAKPGLPRGVGRDGFGAAARGGDRTRHRRDLARGPAGDEDLVACRGEPPAKGGAQPALDADADDDGGDPVHGQAVALRQLWSLAWREAQTATFADAFRVIAVGFLVATLMVTLMRKVAPRPAPPADAH